MEGCMHEWDTCLPLCRMLRETVNKRAVRIPLECIYLFKGKIFNTMSQRFDWLLLFEHLKLIQIHYYSCDFLPSASALSLAILVFLKSSSTSWSASGLVESTLRSCSVAASSFWREVLFVNYVSFLYSMKWIVIFQRLLLCCCTKNITPNRK